MIVDHSAAELYGAPYKIIWREITILNYKRCGTFYGYRLRAQYMNPSILKDRTLILLSVTPLRFLEIPGSLCDTQLFNTV